MLHNNQVKTESIIAEIKKGINTAREVIEPYGATIPKTNIVVVIKDAQGVLEAIKSITV